MSVKHSTAPGDVDVIGTTRMSNGAWGKHHVVPLKRGTWVDRPGRRHYQNEMAKRALREMPREGR
jgi:hypothetical protein